MKKFIIIPVIIVMILGGIMLVRKRHNELENEPVAERPAPYFHVERAFYGSFPVKQRYSGVLHAGQTVSLAPQIQGRILKINADEGDEFLAGSILAEIDSEEISSQIRSLESVIKHSETDYGLQQTNLNRKRELLKSKAISIQAMDEAEEAFSRAFHTLGKNRSELEALKTRLAYTVLKAPFSGIVVNRYQEPGDMASPGSPILNIENPSLGYKISVQVPDKLANDSILGNEVLLVSHDKAIEAEVSAILPFTGDKSSLGLIEIYLDNRPFGLPVGSSMGVDITVKRPKGFILSERVLLNQKNDSFVFKVDAENRIVPVKVDVLGRSGSKVILSGDLNEEEFFVVTDESRLLSLKEGQQITPLKQEKP